jgi:hypothetical protein
MTAAISTGTHARTAPVGSPWPAQASTRWADAWEDTVQPHDLDDDVVDLYRSRPRPTCIIVPTPSATTIAADRVLTMLVDTKPEDQAMWPAQSESALRPMTVNQAWMTLFAIAMPWAVLTGVSFNKTDFIITPGIGIFGLLALGVIGATILTWAKTNIDH